MESTAAASAESYLFVILTRSRHKIVGLVSGVLLSEGDLVDELSTYRQARCDD
jgi:hypothetical protein